MDGEFPIHVNRKGYGELVLEELFIVIFFDFHLKIEEDDDYMYLVMPYCEMRLLEFVTSAKYEDLWTSELRGDERPSKNLTEFLKELVTGIKSLHGVNIVHGDITPHNVLVHFRRDGDKKLKPSPRIICVGSINNPKGTVGFRAPEVIAVGELTKCSDMFSVGCLLYFCLTKKDNLFGNFDKRDDNVIKRHYNLRRIDHMEEAKDLIGNLLDHDSTMRRTSSQVLQHPFFWDSKKRINFLSDASELLHGHARRGFIVPTHHWDSKLSESLLAYSKEEDSKAKYNYSDTLSLLRFIRNTKKHLNQIQKRFLREKKYYFFEDDSYASMEHYFWKRFPTLLMDVYRHIREEFEQEATIGTMKAYNIS